MGILGALFAGVSGLDVYSNSIEVVGNNIANANTSGFKASRAEFSDILASSLSGSSSGSQIGRGVQLSAVSAKFTQGSFESTSSGTDLAIDGKGFFIVKNNDGTFYSRAGQFNINAKGLLVNARGDRVQGVVLDASGNPSGANGDLNLQVTNSPPKKTAKVDFIANLNASEPVLGSKGNNTSGGAVASRFQFSAVGGSANNTILFNDGSARTANLITNGALVDGVQYTGAQVATAIKTAMEATNAGADTYTVAYNTATKKFDITSPATNSNAVTLSHSAAGSTASAHLGFSNTDDTLATGATVSSDSQVQFNVLGSRNSFTFSIDGGYYVGTGLPSDSGALTATLTAGAYTADELAQEIEVQMNKADDSGSAIDRVRAVRVTYDSTKEKFTISSQTSGAERTISVPSDSNSITIPPSSVRLKESLLGVLGTTNMNDADTFSFATGFNDSIRVDFDSGGGGAASSISLIATGGLTNGAVVTGQQVATALSTALSTDPNGTFTVAYDTTANTFKITAGGGNGESVDILWADGTTTAEVDLGFTTTTTVAAAGTVTGTALTTLINARSNVILDGTGGFDVTDPANLTSSSFSTSLPMYDSLGTAHSILIYFRKIGENIWEYNGTMKGSDIAGPTGVAALEQVLYGRLWFTESGKLDIEDKFVGPTNPDGTTNLSDGNTAFSPGNNGFTFPKLNRFNFEGGAAQDQLVSFDFGTSITTDSTATGGLDGVTQFAGQSAIINQTQDGFTTGTLQGIAVGRNGNISGSFSNGQTSNLARIVLGNFNAPQGLSSRGSSLYAATQNSGQAILGQATTAGFGLILSNSIELSNVDIAEEFVKLIQDQQAFQANARIISSTEKLLEEVVNLTR